MTAPEDITSTLLLELLALARRMHANAQHLAASELLAIWARESKLPPSSLDIYVRLQNVERVDAVGSIGATRAVSFTVDGQKWPPCIDCGAPCDASRNPLRCLVCQLDADRLELEAHVEHTRRDAECELCEQEAELEPGTFTPHKHAGPTAAAAWPAGCLLNFEEIAEQAFDQQAELEPGTLTPQRKYHWGPEQQAAADLCAEERPSSCNVQCTRCPSIDAFIVAADGKRLCAECNLVDRLLSGPTAADAVAIAQAHAATGQAPRARARRRESLADLDITSTGFGVLIKPKEPTQ